MIQLKLAKKALYFLLAFPLIILKKKLNTFIFKILYDYVIILQYMLFEESSHKEN